MPTCGKLRRREKEPPLGHANLQSTKIAAKSLAGQVAAGATVLPLAAAGLVVAIKRTHTCTHTAYGPGSEQFMASVGEKCMPKAAGRRPGISIKVCRSETEPLRPSLQLLCSLGSLRKLILIFKVVSLASIQTVKV